MRVNAFLPTLFYNTTFLSIIQRKNENSRNIFRSVLLKTTKNKKWFTTSSGDGPFGLHTGSGDGPFGFGWHCRCQLKPKGPSPLLHTHCYPLLPKFNCAIRTRLFTFTASYTLSAIWVFIYLYVHFTYVLAHATLCAGILINFKSVKSYRIK